MLKIKFLDDIFSENRKYQILPQEDKTSILKDVTEYTQEGTKINALLMQSIIDEVNHNTPVGVIHPYAGQTAPNGYLICDGSVVSRETYADLFQVLGTTYGIGDGETTFTLPDLRSTTTIGANDSYTLGCVYGENEVTLALNQMPSHTHTQAAHMHTATGSSVSSGSHAHGASSGSAGAHGHSASSGGAGGHSHSISVASNGSHQHYGLFYGGASKNFSLNSGGSMYRLSWSGDGASDGGSYYSGVSGAHAHSASSSSVADHAHSISVASNGAHTHTVSIASDGAHTHGINVSVANANPVIDKTGGSLAHNNMQKSLAINYIIKF